MRWNYVTLMTFVGAPVLAAVAVIAVGAPGVVAPLIVIGSGIGWGVVGGRMVMRTARDHAASNDVDVGEALNGVNGEQLLAEQPLLTFVPFLVTASWVTILVGLVWLAIVDYRLGLAVVGAGAALWYLAWLRASARRTGGAD